MLSFADEGALLEPLRDHRRWRRRLRRELPVLPRRAWPRGGPGGGRPGTRPGLLPPGHDGDVGGRPVPLRGAQGLVGGLREGGGVEGRAPAGAAACRCQNCRCRDQRFAARQPATSKTRTMSVPTGIK